jgi:hypothetical protein
MRIGKVGRFIAMSYMNPDLRGRTIFLEGKSGIGKSDTFKQVSKFLEQHVDNWAGVIDIRLSQREPSDFIGVPTIIDGRTHSNPPSFFPKPGTSGLLVLDEITSAPNMLQAAAYQICLDRRLGEWELPEGWMVVAAGNLASDRGVTFQMAAPLRNRMTCIEVETVLEDWEMHAAKHGCRPDVLSFLHNRGDYLHKFDAKTVGQFPTPRGWMAVSKRLGMDFGSLADTPEGVQAMRVEAIAGEVGKEAAADFEAWLRVYGRIPDLDKIEKDPENTPVPDAINEQHCIMMGISVRLNEKNFEAYHTYLKRLPKEFCTLAVKLAYKRDKGLTKSPAFGAWAIENQDAFMRT